MSGDEVRIYKGQRSNGRPVVTIHEQIGHGLERKGWLSHYYRHSADGFEWGYGGSGPSDLALSILRDHSGADVADRWYMEFKWDFVSHFEHAGWSLSSADIDSWLRSKIEEEETRT